MKLLVILLVVAALGCQMVPLGTECPALRVVGIEEGKVQCQLRSPTNGIWIVRGRLGPSPEPVPDTEYFVSGEWTVDNLDWCRHRVEWFQLGSGKEYSFTISADTSLPFRIALDSQRLVVQKNEETGVTEVIREKAIRLVGEPQS